MARIKTKKKPADLVQKLLSRSGGNTALAEKSASLKADTLANVQVEKQLANLINIEAPVSALVEPPGPEAAIDLACKISDTLIFFGWAQDRDDPIKSIKLGGMDKNLASRLHRYGRPDVTKKLNDSAEYSLGFLLMVDVPKATPGGTITLENRAGSRVLSYQLTAELKANPVFNEYLGEMLHVAESQGFTGVHGLMSKFIVPVVKKESDIRAAIDLCYWLPGGMLFTVGWVFSNSAHITSLKTTIGGIKHELYSKATLLPREDLRGGFPNIGIKAKTAGFISCIKTTKDEHPATLVIEVTASDKDNFTLEVAPKKLEDRQEFSRIALSYLDTSKDGFSRIFDQHLGETLQLGLKHIDKTHFQLKQKQFGVPPAQPKISVIVPLYGRIDFVKYQLSQFADDPDFKRDVELIYVLDDPKLESMFFRYCADQAPLFQVPFKAATYGMNLGYAGANNVGVQLASAEYLLLLNSDVLPDSTGWVSHLLNTYKSLNDAGAIAPKLLYEDGSIQHAGIAFERFAAIDNMWANEHPGKGMPDIEPVSDKPTEVPAVTGACLMISKALYEKVGGLDEQYFLGDFEDTDLCLKLIEAGKKNYYVSNLKLYHLERQSQSLFENNDWKTKVTIYNAWQHTKRWDALISKLTGETA